MIGYLAAVLVTVAYLPEAYNCYKTKKCGISYFTIILLMVGMLLWTIHAMNRADYSLLASSMFSFFQILFISNYKIKDTWVKE